LVFHRFLRAFLHLSEQDAQRIRKALDTLAENPRTPGMIKLTNAPVANYRYRVGDYRLLFEIDDDNRQILLYDIIRRDERTYKRR